MASRKKMTPTEVAEATVRQLKSESEIPKIKVSVAIKDLMDYIEANQGQDYLVKGFETSPKKNPFRKKKLNSCSLF